MTLSDQILRKQAMEILKILNIQRFSASSGYIENFKKRFDIGSFSIFSKKRDTKIISAFIAEQKNIINEYSLDDIFNANEIGLFHNLTSEVVVDYKEQQCHIGELSNDRITILLACNASGTEKLPPLIIGNRSHPLWYNEVKVDKRSCTYRCNKCAWMTSAIFMEWLDNLNSKCISQERNILMFLGKCHCHLIQDNILSNIKILYFPPICLKSIQPIDMGISKDFKYHYRKEQLTPSSGMLAEEHKWNIPQMIKGVCCAWNNVDTSYIKGSWSRSKLLDNINGEQFEDLPIIDSDMCELVEIDDHIAVSETYCLHNQEANKDSNENECIEDNISPLPSQEDMLNAVNLLNNFILQGNDQIHSSWLEVQEYCLNYPFQEALNESQDTE